MLSKLKLKEMLKLILKVLIIYFFFHIGEVCLIGDKELLDENTLKIMFFLTIAIFVYYLCFDNIIEKLI